MKNFFSFLVLSSTFFSPIAEAVGIEILGTYYQLDTIDGKFPRTWKLKVFDSQGEEILPDGKVRRGCTFESFDSQGNRVSPPPPGTIEGVISELPTSNQPVKVKFIDNQIIPDNMPVKFSLTFDAVRFSTVVYSPVLYVTPDIEAVRIGVYRNYNLSLGVKKRGIEEWRAQY